WKWHWHGSWYIEHRSIFGGPFGGRQIADKPRSISSGVLFFSFWTLFHGPLPSRQPNTKLAE
ncbi:MAG: hypothetical protein CTY21_13425, partial [Methylomonas sp.]